jgi:hypothetical protein
MIADDIKVIQVALADWAASNQGSVKLAHDVPHLFKLLGENPGGVRAAILFAGETIRDETYSDVTSRVDRKYWIAFSRGYTLESYAGKSLIDGIAGGPPLFQVIEAARDSLRLARFTQTDEDIVYYKGIELLTFEGVTLDAYRIEIAVCADIGQNLSDTEGST